MFEPNPIAPWTHAPTPITADAAISRNTPTATESHRRFPRHTTGTREPERFEHVEIGSPIDTLLGLAVVVLLVGVNGFFVAAELGLVAADRARLEREAAAGRRRARAALSAVRRLAFHLSGIQLGVTAASLVLGLVAAPAIARAIESPMHALVGTRHAHGVALIVGFVVATTGTALLGELIPKNVAVARPVRVAYALITPLRIYTVVFGPLIKLLSGAANWTVRLVGIEPQQELASVRSLEELELLIRSSGEEGSIDAEAFDLLTRTLRFNSKTAADAMVPRPDMRTIAADATVADLVARSIETGFSRFPVTLAAAADDVTGIVLVKDALTLDAATRDAAPVSTLAKEALFVPESRDLGSLLTELRAEGVQLAMVVDEFGDTAGLITLEDILEEIVGDIADEYDRPTAFTRWQPSGQFVLSGSLHADEVFDACGFEIPEGDYETLAGYVLAGLGAIPKPGDGFEYDGWRVEVVSMDRRRVESVRLVAPVAEEPA